MKHHFSFSKAGLSFGLFLAAATVSAAAIGALLFWRLVVADNIINTQQLIGDSSLLFSSYFKHEFEQMKKQLVDVGEVMHSKAGIMPSVNPGGTSSRVNTEYMESHQNILDLSLWKKKGTSSPGDTGFDAEKVFMFLNSKSSEVNNSYTNELERLSVQEKAKLTSAFQGHFVVTFPPTNFPVKNVALVAIPLKRGASDEVITAHIHLDWFQKSLMRDRMVTLALVDEFGDVFAHTESERVGKRGAYSQSKLFQAWRTGSELGGQITYEDENGSFYGGYTRVGIGQLAVLASISKKEADASVLFIEKTMIFYLFACFFFFLGSGYLFSIQTTIHIRSKNQIRFGKFQLFTGSEYRAHEAYHHHIIAQSHQSPKKTVGIVMYGSLVGIDHLVEQSAVEDFADSINDFYAIAASVVDEYGGVFEKSFNSSFVGIWGLPKSDGTDVWKALRCALEIRKSMQKLNEAKKVNGQRILGYRIGIHLGPGVAAQVGISELLSYTFLGETVNCAKVLSQLAPQSQVDLLVSQDVWSQTDGKFEGDPLGEAKLTENLGLIHFYSITGYRDESGQIIKMEIPQTVSAQEMTSVIVLKDKKPHKWLVNNGSQIIGPMTAEEIAARIYAQELDFDCECWAEGTGNSAHIRDAKIFEGSEDKSAFLWVYDGKVIHGPMTLGFLKTAIDHGAILMTHFICRESTVNGWKLLSEEISGLLPLQDSNTKPNEQTQARLDPQPEGKDQQKKAA